MCDGESTQPMYTPATMDGNDQPIRRGRASGQWAARSAESHNHHLKGWPPSTTAPPVGAQRAHPGSQVCTGTRT